MRIILLIESLDIRRGGLERWASRFILWLSRHGHSVTVVAITRTEESLPPGVLFQAIPDKTSRIGRAMAAAELINRMDADLVYDLGVGVGADILHPQFGSRVTCADAELNSRPAWFRLWKQRSPVARLRQKKLQDFEDKQYRGQRGMLIAPSHFAAAPLIEKYHLSNDRIRVIYNGVDPEVFRPEMLTSLRESTRSSRGLEDQHIHLLQVAVNFQLKGVDTSLHALAALPDHVQLTVVGGGRIASFQKLARRLGVAERVIFTGTCHDPRPWFSAADIYIHPTRHDAGSLSVLEAWAAGLPVITTRKNGSAELMTEGQHGFLMDDPENAAGLAGHINRLFDADLRTKMALPCRILAEQNSLHVQFQTIARLAREMIDSGQATGRLLTPDQPRS